MKKLQDYIDEVKQKIQDRRDAKNGYAATTAPSTPPEVQATLVEKMPIRFEEPVVNNAPAPTNQNQAATQKSNQPQSPNYILPIAIGLGSIVVIAGLFYALK